jgi:hypothetical protein
MDDIEAYIEANAVNKSSCLPFSCFHSKETDERRKRKFDAGFDAIVRRHATSARKWKSGYIFLGWTPGSLKWFVSLSHSLNMSHADG